MAVLEDASDAAQFTVVAPRGNADPEAGLHDVWTGVVPPVTAGGSNTTVDVAVGILWIEMFVGQEI